MDEFGMIALLIKNPKDTVNIPVQHAERRSSPRAKQVRLHTGNHIEFRIGGTRPVVRHYNMAGNTVFPCFDPVEIFQRLFSWRIDKILIVGDITKGLVHHHNYIDLLALLLHRLRLLDVSLCL